MPWAFEGPCPGSLTSTFLGRHLRLLNEELRLMGRDRRGPSPHLQAAEIYSPGVSDIFSQLSDDFGRCLIKLSPLPSETGTA